MSADVVDLTELKREVRRLLPRGHPIRRALENEPDVLPVAEGRAVLRVYARLLLAGREGGRRG